MSELAQWLLERYRDNASEHEIARAIAEVKACSGQKR